MPVWLVLGKVLRYGAAKDAHIPLSFALVAVNGGFNGPVDINVDLSAIGLPMGKPAIAIFITYLTPSFCIAGAHVASHDVWTGKDEGVITTGIWQGRV